MRRALGIDYGGKIAFRVGEHGVSVHRVDAGHEDPAIDSFLAFLAEDIKRRPEAVAALSPSMVERITALTAGVQADPHVAIEGDVDL